MSIRPLKLRTLLTVVTVLVISATAGCGGSQPEELTIPVKVDGDVMTPETIEVKQGDMVTLQIQAAEAGEFHLHTYDIEKDIESEGLTDFFFVAEATGRFRITYHPEDNEESEEEADHDEEEDGEHEEGGEVDIGFLQVNPR